MTTTTVTVDVVSDVVCPWCYLGMRNLLQAWSKLGQDAISLYWRPFQLDPTVPAAGLDRQEYMLGKFGSVDRINSAHDRLKELGKAVGIAFNFDAIKIAPNTLDAHRIIYWAGTLSPETQTRLVAALFRGYFEEGRNIGDHEVLLAIASEIGMNTAHARELLRTDTNRKEVLEAITAAQRMGISGVPCFLLENRYVISGAQPPEVLENAIRQVADAKANGELDNGQ